jgi:hypothetical protein
MVGGRLALHFVVFLQSPLEIVAVHGFQKVIDAVVFECLQCVFIVRSSEDDRTRNLDPVENLEALAVGQLDIQEDQVRVGLSGSAVFQHPFHGLLDTVGNPRNIQ